MERSSHHRWLARFAGLTALATLALICLGGLVTSHGVGLSVPDWPTTYGYNMFFFPISKWVGGIFYEHTHRLAASLVGVLTIVLAVWLCLRESRRWLCRLGIAAVILVILQGVLGGLRVTALKDEIGVLHAALAQIFFLLLVAITVFSTNWWKHLQAEPVAGGSALLWLWGGTTLLLLVQLLVGAAMRHQHAGLAIPDFPLAYGRWWPEISPEAVLRYNQQRGEATALNEITSAQILLQMSHRMLAAVILFLVLWTAPVARRRLGSGHVLARGSFLWAGLIGLQALLGAATIWTNKSADVATAHVAVGALTLATGAVLFLVGRRCLGPMTRESLSREPAGCEVAA